MRWSRICIVFVLLISACSKESDDNSIQPNLLSRPVNTGYIAYDQNGFFIGNIGNPNVFRGKREGIQIPDRPIISTYPNPSYIYEISERSARWYFAIDPQFESVEKHLWMVEADFNTLGSNTIIENGLVYQISSGSYAFEATFRENTITIFLDDAQSRDYRLYIEINGTVYSDNLARRPFSTF